MTDLNKLTAANAARWAAMTITPSLASVVDKGARRLVDAAAKARYVAVSAKTNVPWAVIAVIHARESSQNWKASLAQGDPWNEVSRHVPKGRGPFASWEDAAMDALVACAPKAATWHDWTPGGTMTLLEQYNGLGYAAKGLPSPYIWASTDQYVKGKYVSDGVFNPNEVDHQLGCAALLSRMIALDPTIRFAGQPAATPPPVAPPAPVATPPEIPATDAHPDGFWSEAGSTLAGIFHDFVHLR
jgi:lysozyme family protein